MALTKDHLIRALAEENGYSFNQSTEIVETLLGLIKSKLASGEDVLISGFGKFCVKKKRERRGRNPATGESMILEARKVVTFRCSGRLRKKNYGHRTYSTEKKQRYYFGQLIMTYCLISSKSLQGNRRY